MGTVLADPDSSSRRVTARPSLARAVGRWSFVTVVVNSVIGGDTFATQAVPETRWLHAILLLVLSICAALVVLRRREGPAPFRLPAGPAVASLGIGFSVWLPGTRSVTQAGALAGFLALGLGFWLARAWQAQEVAR